MRGQTCSFVYPMITYGSGDWVDSKALNLLRLSNSSTGVLAGLICKSVTEEQFDDLRDESWISRLSWSKIIDSKCSLN